MANNLWMALLLVISGPASVVSAAEVKQTQPNIWNYEDKAIRIEVRLQRPENMAAFYEARGFSTAGIKLVASKCFITIGMLNKGFPVLWLEPARWSIVTQNQTIKRYPMSYWQQQFDNIALPDANRAAFRWTQLPEQRDLRIDEPVGGNITLPPLTEKFTLIMEFDVGRDRTERYQKKFPDLHCAGRLP